MHQIESQGTREKSQKMGEGKKMYSCKYELFGFTVWFLNQAENLQPSLPSSVLNEHQWELTPVSISKHLDKKL